MTFTSKPDQRGPRRTRAALLPLLALVPALPACGGSPGELEAALARAEAARDLALVRQGELEAERDRLQVQLATEDRLPEGDRLAEGASGSELRRLRERVFELESERASELAAARERLFSQEAEIERLGAVLEEERERGAGLGEELAAARAELGRRNRRAEEERVERVELELEIQRLLAESARLRERAEATPVTAAAPSAELEARPGAAPELEQARRELEQARAALRLAQGEVKRLGAENAALQEEHRAREAALDLAASDPERTAHALELVRAELERAQAALDAARDEHRRCGELRTEVESELVALQEELTREREARLAREQEWLAYNHLISSFDLQSVIAELGFPVQAEGLEDPLAPREEAEPEPDPVAERSAEVLRSLRTLMRLEEVRGLDLLEAGRVGEGFTGPVVFRVLDDRGRLAGSLAAERLFLEASRAGRTVTLVLQGGHESRGGARYPFHEGVRRILLPHVDPEPWIEALPELFPGAEREPIADDGLWDRAQVRSALNQLLRQDAAGGYYELRALGGVVDGVLRDVQLLDYDRDGRLQRRLFADRMSLAALQPDEPLAKGVVITLEDGISMRGDQKSGFLDGRMRLFLPRARPASWRTARLPGFWSPGPRPAAPPEEQEEPGDGSPPPGEPGPGESGSGPPA